MEQENYIYKINKLNNKYTIMVNLLKNQLLTDNIFLNYFKYFILVTINFSIEI